MRTVWRISNQGRFRRELKETQFVFWSRRPRRRDIRGLRTEVRP